MRGHRENSPIPQLVSGITKGCPLPLHITANYTMSRRAARLCRWQFRNDLPIRPRFDAKSHSEKHQNLAVRRNCRRQTEQTLISKTFYRLSKTSITRRPRAPFMSRLRSPTGKSAVATDHHQANRAGAESFARRRRDGLMLYGGVSPKSVIFSSELNGSSRAAKFAAPPSIRSTIATTWTT